MKLEELQEKLNKALIEKHEKSGLISISSLIYDCLRRAFYTETLGDFFDKDTLETFWVGKAIHEKKLFDGEAELELKNEGIIGVIDELVDGSLIEKKSVNQISWKFVPDHYLTQVDYYYWLLSNNGYKVENAFLIYILKERPHDKKIIPVMLRPLEVIEKEILERAKILKEALEKKELPERKMSWLCKRCNYASKCYSENGKRNSNNC